MGWINSIFFLSIGLAMLLLRRWLHLRWFLAYALITSTFAITYYLLLNVSFLEFNSIDTYVFYLGKRLVSYLLLLGAAREILAKDFDKKPWWIWPAFAGIALSIVFPMTPIKYLAYFLPRTFLFLGIASAFAIAVKKGHAPLIALSVLSVGTVVQDLFLFLLPGYEIWRMQVVVGPLLFLLMCSITAIGLFWPEVVKVFKWLKDNGPWSVPKTGYVATDKQNLTSFFSEADLSMETEQETISGDKEHSREYKELNQRVKILEDFFTSALLLEALEDGMSEPEVMTQKDLMEYLGISATEAGDFVKRHNLKKLDTIFSPGDWSVLKSEIDHILLQEEDEDGMDKKK